VIAAIDPQLRLELSDETLDEVVHTVSLGVTCSVCEAPLRPDQHGHANVLLLRERTSGDTLVRFAHETCAPSRLIEVDRLPAPAPAAKPAPRRAEFAWALSVRVNILPTVVLAWDLELVTHLAVGGRVLLDALCLEGLRGGRPLAQIAPRHYAGITARREAATLALECVHGRELLAIDDLDRVMPVLHVAARQRELLLVIGERLALDGGDLDEAERRLLFGEALAARVTYSDPELAAIPLRDHRALRLGRRLVGLTPSARARKRRSGTRDASRGHGAAAR
jgi:hypothetical protein